MRHYINIAIGNCLLNELPSPFVIFIFQSYLFFYRLFIFVSRCNSIVASIPVVTILIVAKSSVHIANTHVIRYRR